jgi:hypothetical protein
LVNDDLSQTFTSTSFDVVIQVKLAMSLGIVVTKDLFFFVTENYMSVFLKKSAPKRHPLPQVTPTTTETKALMFQLYYVLQCLQTLHSILKKLIPPLLLPSQLWLFIMYSFILFLSQR